MSSVTPKAINALRSRTSLSVTPTPLAASSILDDASDHSDWEGHDDWGDDAMLEWHAEPGRARSEDEDDASSVAPGDAGLPVTDEDTEDDDAWGREAYLTWDSQVTDEEAVEEVIDDSDLGGVVEETAGDLTARGMPNYAEWTMKSLQKVCEGFGYRTITKHDALVDIATQCWKALNPPVAPPPRLAFRPSSTSSSRSNSVSSADIPLSSTRKTRKTGPAGKANPKAKGKSAAEPLPSTQQAIDLDQRFFRMIRDDEALWIRILRYEPIAFDELVSKAIAAGIDDRGWKARLKLFLDSQSITFFTEDPTGTRRRH